MLLSFVFRLYLDSVMRSNKETDSASKTMPGFYYDADLDLPGLKQDKTRIHKLVGFFRSIWRSSKYRHSTAMIVPTDSFLSRQMKMFSYSEVELKKTNPILTEIGVQTGDSLQMTAEEVKFAYLKRLRDDSLLPYHGPVMTDKCKMEPICSKMRSTKERFKDIQETSSEHSMNIIERASNLTTEFNELNVMKFFKSVRSGSTQMSMPQNLHDSRLLSIHLDDEIEVKNTMMDQIPSRPESTAEDRVKQSHSPVNTFAQTDSVAGPSGNVSKRLRFVELQSSDQDHEDEDHEHAKELPRRFWGVGKPKAKKKTTLPFLSPR